MHRARQWHGIGGRVALALALCGGCDPAPAPPPVTRDGGMPFATPTYSARRPGHTYYLGNEGGRCMVYRTHGSRRVVLERTRCPRDLDPGERVRLAGSTCLLETDGGATLTRCPKELFRVEQEDPIDAG